MSVGSERRKNKRIELESKLVVRRLDGGAQKEEEMTIEITDVSKTGIGFNADRALEIGAIYEGFLVIWTKEVLHTFIEIVRITKNGSDYTYGGTFVGMPEMEAVRISVYDTVHTHVDG